MTITHTIEIESVRSALDAMRQGEPLAVNHPLTHSLCMWVGWNGNTSNHHHAPISDALLFHRLTVIIQHSLNRHRALYNLKPVTRRADYETVKANVAEDFQP